MLRSFVPALLLLSSGVDAQQVQDSLFRPSFADPAFNPGTGPCIAIDQGHHNFHTRSGRYQACARVLEADGFRVVDNDGAFTEKSLKNLDALVIANALNVSNTRQWALPTPSAFTEKEIAIVKAWVEGGGGLLLIAGHMPFAGAAQELAAAFGFTFSNCFAVEDVERPLERFYRGAGLSDHLLTIGVDTVVTYTGSAFQLPDGASTLIALNDGYTLLEPDTAWRFNESTRERKGAGWYQAAVVNQGRGRVAIFGEAAMFSAQLAGPQAEPTGMNMPEARDNVRFLRNVARWLTGPDEPRMK